jgi:RHH-type proline utilization regulon transcriptional repressor/proline dehydrogenase/delta 1-pyrroline-5-carboxylate dehydrogenase
MRAEHLDEAIALANGTAYGLTSGIQTLDDREIDRWLDRIEAGNLYVNRPITGAMVGRQPFGGWKASSVGPGAKVGGPNYVLQLARWRETTLPTAGASLRQELSALLKNWLEETDDEQAQALLRASAASYAQAWQRHFSLEHDPMRIVGERNVFRYRPCRRVLIRAEAVTPTGRLALQQVILAALTCDVPLTISLSRGDPSSWLPDHAAVAAIIENEADAIERLRSSTSIERLRVLDTVSPAVRAAAHEAGVAVIDAPVLATGRLELRWYLREQTIAHVMHRYGNVMEPAAAE